MYDFHKETINDEPITDYAVWFQTPMGLSSTLSKAVEICEELDMDARFCVIPVPVGITENSYEVLSR